MTDIVERLDKAPIAVKAAMFDAHKLLKDASNEIVRLRKLNDKNIESANSLVALLALIKSDTWDDDRRLLIEQ